MHFPAFRVEAARMLLEEAEVVGIGVDSLSIDDCLCLSTVSIAHCTWLPANCRGVKSMANLDHPPPVGTGLITGAPKHRGGTGGPCRLIAPV